MRINLPKNVSLIIDRLKENGYDAYAVGGCIRDSILGRIPNDWDITTSAKPAEVKTIFERTVDTGIKHGTVTVLIDKECYEVTTYRIDGVYLDNRHPENVTFTDDLKEDLRRRDFTINAMAYNDDAGLVDVFDGQEDIKKKRIRAVGNAKERFEEDALRIMRAVRFAGQLGYSIEENTFEAGRALVNNLKNISAERIQVELVKLITSDNPQIIEEAYKMGITKIIIPEFDLIMDTPQNTPHHMYSVGVHTLHALCNIKREGDYIQSIRHKIPYDEEYFKYLRLCMLFHDMGKPACRTTEKNRDHFYGHPAVSAKIANSIMRRLKFDNKTIKMVCGLVEYHDLRFDPKPELIRKWIFELGKEEFYLRYLVHFADMYAQSMYQREEKELRLEKEYNIYSEIIKKEDPIFISDLAINGNDLIELDIAKGRNIGLVLNRIIEEIHINPLKNTKDQLIPLAKEYAKEIE